MEVEMSTEVVAESCDISSSSTRKRKRETSIVWNTFVKLPRSTDGRLRAQCKICKKTFLADSKVGTSTMKRHIVEKHISNLIVREGLLKADGAIAKIREGVKHIKHSEGRILKFVGCIKDLGLPCSKKLRQDMVVRWNSTYQMLESAIQYKKAYIQYKLVDQDFQHSLLEEEWERVEKIAEFLKPFYDITVLFSGSKYPTANLYLHNVWKIEKRLREAKVGEDLVMSKLATPMLRKFKKYWRSYSIILSLAVILDPRYKLNFVKFCFSKVNAKTAEARVNVIEENLQLLFKEYYVPSTTFVEPGEHSFDSSSNLMRDELDEFDIFESQMESSIGKTQLDLYLEEPSLDRKSNSKLDVLGFWKDNRLRYPELSLMARDVLSIPITTVASESAFSMGGRVIGKFGSSILPANVEAKLCTRDWLNGQEACDESDSDEDEIAIDLRPYHAKISSV